MRTAYAVTLPSGRVAEVVEPTVAEVLLAKRAAGDASGSVAATRALQALLRVALRRYDGQPVGPGPWPFGGADALALARTLATLIQPLQGALESVRAGVSVEAGALARWTVTLPSGAPVTLTELSADAVFAAQAAGDKEGNRATAAAYVVALDGLRRSAGITASVDDWPWTPAETEILGALWAELHGLAGDAVPSMVPLTG